MDLVDYFEAGEPEGYLLDNKSAISVMERAHTRKEAIAVVTLLHAIDMEMKMCF